MRWDDWDASDDPPTQSMPGTSPAHGRPNSSNNRPSPSGANAVDRFSPHHAAGSNAGLFSSSTSAAAAAGRPALNVFAMVDGAGGAGAAADGKQPLFGRRRGEFVFCVGRPIRVHTVVHRVQVLGCQRCIESCCSFVLQCSSFEFF